MKPCACGAVFETQVQKMVHTRKCDSYANHILGLTANIEDLRAQVKEGGYALVADICDVSVTRLRELLHSTTTTIVAQGDAAIKLPKNQQTCVCGASVPGKSKGVHTRWCKEWGAYMGELWANKTSIRDEIGRIGTTKAAIKYGISRETLRQMFGVSGASPVMVAKSTSPTIQAPTATEFSPEQVIGALRAMLNDYAKRGDMIASLRRELFVKQTELNMCHERIRGAEQAIRTLRDKQQEPLRFALALDQQRTCDDRD